MSFLLDTDVVAGWLKGWRADVALLQEFGKQDLAISIVTYGEIYEGIYYGRDPRAHEDAFRNFLRWVEVLPLTEAGMRHFARIRGHLRRVGQLIGDPDIMIAGTALEHDLTLVTHNARHFGRVPDLKLYAPDRTVS